VTLENDIRALLLDGVGAGVFPGAVAVVTDANEVVARVAVGNRSIVPVVRRMEIETLFDLASLTKPLVTAPAILLLAEDGALRLDDPVSTVLPGFRRDDVTIRHLLTHTAGLPAWRPLYREPAEPERVISYLGAIPSEQPVGTRVVYSCLGYILLGKVVERLTGDSLASFARARLLGPLRMADACFTPSPDRANRCAATETSDSAVQRTGYDVRTDRRDGILCGTVHDENAWFLGGIAGNAGLFGTADDLTQYAFCLLNDGRPVFSLDTYTLLRDPVVNDGETVRTHAWIVLGDGSRTHTGFTGTSFRWNPERRRAAILLTNRVHPDASNNAILDFRVRFHGRVFG
jgi:CubicO group peptidase (beta-lactamase class C family)